MSLSPEQMRKKSEAQAEALKHQRYAQADGSMKSGGKQEYFVSPGIKKAGERVDAATAKEEATIGKIDNSQNGGQY